MRVSFAFLFLFLGMAILVSCGGNHSDHSGHGKRQAPKTYLDSLDAFIWAAHDAVMPKMGKVRGAQQTAARLLDSLSLIEKNRNTTLPKDLAARKQALQQLIDRLNYADYAMDRWMREYNIDSAQQQGDGRRRYLEAEKLKVDKVKAAILEGLSQADSLFAELK